MKSLFYILIPLLLSKMGHTQDLIPKPIVLGRGTSVSLPAPHLQAVRVSNTQIIRIKDQQSTVKVIAKKTGVSDLEVGSKHYRVHVLRRPQYETYQSLNHLIQKFLGLHLEVRRQQIVVSGQLHRFSDWLALARTYTSRENSYLFLAGVDPDVQRDVQTFFRQQLKENGLPHPILRFEPTPGVIVSESLRSQNSLFESFFSPFGLELIYTKAHLSPAPLVRVQIVVAELTHDMGRTLGFQWDSAYQAQLIPQWNANGGLLATLQAAENAGKGQLLARPSLLCRSGSKAEFLAGGEFPIRIIGFKSKDLIWKKHGVLLTLMPQADFSGQMSIQLTTEVSLLDPGQSVEGIPALKTNRISSHFDLKGKSTIALSGLIQTQWGKSSEGLPGLRHIPILGQLFQSQNFRNNQSELVVFVTPEIVPEKDHEIHFPKGWTKNAPFPSTPF